jgi:NAD(P)-dependent dehydrogenase (short-subunit alcohol dehydrogenase family)
MRLDGKTAIVTGAANGIGRAIAEAFGAQGASVLVTDIEADAGEDVAAEIRKRGQAASFVRVDVSDETQIARAVTMAAAKTGRIDVLCNNAAHLAQWHNVLDATQQEWNQCISIALMGTAHFTRLALPHMTPHHAGSIINIASVQGMTGARSSAAYTSIKHAIIGLTRSTACDFGPQGIRCNALCPGAIQTRISPAPGSEMHQRQISKTMLGRTGEPREIAAAAVFLASDESSYVTGAVLAVDGGWTAM